MCDSLLESLRGYNTPDPAAVSTSHGEGLGVVIFDLFESTSTLKKRSKAGLLVILFYFRKYNLYRIILICFLLLRNHDLAIRSTHNITPL